MLKAASLVLGYFALLFFTFNVGVDFGNDVGFCVGYSVGDQDGKMKPSDNPFCKGAKPERNKVKYAIRGAYLKIIGQGHP